VRTVSNVLRAPALAVSSNSRWDHSTYYVGVHGTPQQCDWRHHPPSLADSSHCNSNSGTSVVQQSWELEQFILMNFQAMSFKLLRK
jgi:hypothetical protein